MNISPSIDWTASESADSEEIEVFFEHIDLKKVTEKFKSDLEDIPDEVETADEIRGDTENSGVKNEGRNNAEGLTDQIRIFTPSEEQRITEKLKAKEQEVITWNRKYMTKSEKVTQLQNEIKVIKEKHSQRVKNHLHEFEKVGEEFVKKLDSSEGKNIDLSKRFQLANERTKTLVAENENLRRELITLEKDKKYLTEKISQQIREKEVDIKTCKSINQNLLEKESEMKKLSETYRTIVLLKQLSEKRCKDMESELKQGRNKHMKLSSFGATTKVIAVCWGLFIVRNLLRERHIIFQFPKSWM